MIYYHLGLVAVPDLKPGEFSLQTAAVRTCGLCGGTISGMGGPGSGSVCKACGDLLHAGKLRGCVSHA